MGHYFGGFDMRFHYKIVLAALAVSLVAAGAGAIAGPGAADIADPGFWLAIGEGLVGVQENGWCKCS